MHAYIHALAEIYARPNGRPDTDGRYRTTASFAPKTMGELQAA